MKGQGSGFTVVEAIVSLGLALLFMLLAAGLLRDAQLASLSVRRQALDPSPQHLAQSLRNDVHRSRRVERTLSGSGSWSYFGLPLTLPDGGRVVYERTDERIVRTVSSADGTPRGARPLMHDVLSWRWLQISSDLVEVEVVFRRRPPGEAARRDWRAPASSTETLRMRLALRALPGRRSW